MKTQESLSINPYVVVCEHTLGVIVGGGIDVLHASVLRGSPSTQPFPEPIPFPSDPKAVRPATLYDFKAFRVSPVGHLVD